MKFAIFFAFLSCALAASSLTIIKIERSFVEIQLSPQNLSFKLSSEDEDKIASEYFERFNKNFGRSRFEAETRKKILLKKFYEVREHNERFEKGEVLYKMELNKFSDLTDEELRKRLGNNKNVKLWPSLDETLPPPPIDREGNSSVPNEWDWDKYTVVQEVQDQGDCGSCYVFAGIAALEGSMCRLKGQCTKLSEQEALECTKGCEGGNADNIYNYAKKKGCAYGSNYKYQARIVKNCALHGSRVPHSKVKNAKYILNNSETQKNFIYEYGPLYVAFDVYNSFFSYESGIYSNCENSAEGSHAVLAVGYGEENGVPYWIVKNSWGKDWGNKGFFKIVRGSNCADIESEMSFPFVN